MHFRLSQGRFTNELRVKRQMYHSELEVNERLAVDNRQEVERIIPAISSCSSMEKRARVKAWLVSGVGTKAFDHLQRAFGSLDAAWRANQDEWQHKGFSQKLWEAWQQGSKLESRVDKILLWADQAENYLIFKDDPLYPPMLSSAPGMPSVLFLKGKIDALKEPQVAIVGSRTPTGEGLRNARDMAFYLAEHGIGVASGLAKGVDTAAHQGAIKGGGPTIAVVAHGLDPVSYTHLTLPTKRIV